MIESQESMTKMPLNLRPLIKARAVIISWSWFFAWPSPVGRSFHLSYPNYINVWNASKWSTVYENIGIAQWLGIPLSTICPGFEPWLIPSLCIIMILSPVYTIFSLFACAEVRVGSILCMRTMHIELWSCCWAKIHHDKGGAFLWLELKCKKMWRKLKGALWSDKKK